MCQRSNGLCTIKNRKVSNISQLSCLVERTGIEHSTYLLYYQQVTNELKPVTHRNTHQFYMRCISLTIIRLKSILII